MQTGKMKKYKEALKESLIVIFVAYLVLGAAALLICAAVANERYGYWGGCVDRPTLRYDYIFPFNKIGCWLGKDVK